MRDYLFEIIQSSIQSILLWVYLFVFNGSPPLPPPPATLKTRVDVSHCRFCTRVIVSSFWHRGAPRAEGCCSLTAFGLQSEEEGKFRFKSLRSPRRFRQIPWPLLFFFPPSMDSPLSREDFFTISGGGAASRSFRRVFWGGRFGNAAWPWAFGRKRHALLANDQLYLLRIFFVWLWPSDLPLLSGNAR